MLLDPRGNLVTSQKREIRISNPRVAKFAAYADDVFRQLDLTVVCVGCGGTPVMANAPGDANWKMECACRVRVLKNPDAPH